MNRVGQVIRWIRKPLPVWLDTLLPTTIVALSWIAAILSKPLTLSTPTGMVALVAFLLVGCVFVVSLRGNNWASSKVVALNVYGLACMLGTYVAGFTCCTGLCLSTTTRHTCRSR